MILRKEVVVMSSATGAAPQPDRRGAHRIAVRSAIGPAVQSLVAVLGQALVAVIVNRDVKTVGRWAAGRGPRGDHDEQRVRDAMQIVELLAFAESPSTIRAWFMGMNPQLDDVSPAEALADDRAREVIAAARSFVADD